MYCSHCASSNSEGSMYCRDCGRELKSCATPVISFSRGPQSQIFCSHCGQQSSTNYLYCQHCGQGLGVMEDGANSYNKGVQGPGGGQGTWSDALIGAVTAVAAGIFIAFAGAKAVALVLAGLAGNDWQTAFLIKESFSSVNPLSTWISSHLAGQYIGFDGSIPDMQINVAAKAYLYIPVVALLVIPFLALLIGSLAANRKIDNNDLLSRCEQGFRMGLIYAGIMVVLSFFVSGEVSVPLPLKQLLNRDLFNGRVVISAGFQLLSVLVKGLVFGVFFGVITSVRFRLPTLLQNYAGDSRSSMLAGVARALSISFSGSILIWLGGFIYLLSKNGLPHGIHGMGGSAFFTLMSFLLLLPNLTIYGLCFGGGASLQMYARIPGMRIPDWDVSLLGGFTQNGIKQIDSMPWFVYIFAVLVMLSLFLGGYRAQRRNREKIHINGLVVAGGYSVIISSLALVSQFNAEFDLGKLGRLVSMMGPGSDKIELFLGVSFWSALLCLALVGFLAATLGALACSHVSGMPLYAPRDKRSLVLWCVLGAACAGAVAFGVYRHVNSQGLSKSAVPVQTMQIPVNNTKSSAGEVRPPVQMTQEDQAVNAVRNFYALVTQRQFRDAYNCFSSGWRSRFTYDGWVTGYNNLLQNRLDQVAIVEPVRGRNARVRFQLTAYDHADGGRVFVQVFTGEWRLINENGRWFLDDADVQRISSHYE